MSKLKGPHNVRAFFSNTHPHEPFPSSYSRHHRPRRTWFSFRQNVEHPQRSTLPPRNLPPVWRCRPYFCTLTSLRRHGHRQRTLDSTINHYRHHHWLFLFQGRNNNTPRRRHSTHHDWIDHGQYEVIPCPRSPFSIQ